MTAYAWPCPRCGRPTTGAYTEGGARWALCADCLQEDT
jgi:NMD protein affecting ribosome stability and mRNA decay